MNDILLISNRRNYDAPNIFTLLCSFFPTFIVTSLTWLACGLRTSKNIIIKSCCVVSVGFLSQMFSKTWINSLTIFQGQVCPFAMMAAIEQSPWVGSLSDVFPFDLIECETRDATHCYRDVFAATYTIFTTHTQTFLVACLLNRSIFLEIIFHIPVH